MKYKFTVKGKSKTDGKYYITECLCNGMSKHEIEEYIKELNFEKDTIKITKENIKK